MIYPSKWKNRDCFFLENDILRAAVLPDLGAKIASLLYKPGGFELAAQSSGDYRQPPHGADFSAYDASGIDDVFPCVTPSRQSVNGKTVDYPDHGEVWTESFACAVSGETLDLSFESRMLSYRYHKKISLGENRIVLDYRIDNTGGYGFPCIWLFHGLFRYEKDMRLLYPPGTKGFVNVYPGGSLGEPGRRFAAEGGFYCFSAVPKREPPGAEKYYVDGPVSEGICGYYYPRSRLLVRLSFDQKVLPYLGFWVSAGGFRGDYNCAFEPASGFYDDIEIARRNQALPRLMPGDTMSFAITIEARQSDCPAVLAP
jgi:hypothetical protein